MLLLVVVLSWIIPTGTFSSGATFTEGEMGRLGLGHLFYGFSYAIQNYAIQIGFLLMVGVFYGVVSKTEDYKEFVNRLANRNSCKFNYFIYNCFTYICSK